MAPGLSRGGGHFYGWLIREEFPEGYRVLCLNCNFSHGVFGYCPHQFPKGQTPLQQEIVQAIDATVDTDDRERSEAPRARQVGGKRK